MIPPSASPDAGERSEPALLEVLRRRIQREGPLSFADFMDMALYHPQWGYYSREPNPVGRSPESDYYTAPARHPAFGTLLGRQVADCLRLVGGSDRQWIEFGPGGGELASSLAAVLAHHELGEGEGIRGALVEANFHRRAAQQARLGVRAQASAIRWLTPAEWSAGEEPVRGCILANEMLDALPVHRLVFRQGRFWEIRVDWRSGPVEIQEPLAEGDLLTQALHECPDPREGQELEVGLEALRWIRHLARRLQKGYAILMDYGYLSGEMFSPRHDRGTLLAYHRHGAGERYFDRIGRQDLTAHVHFTPVIEVARAAGMIVRGPVPQGRFLLALGALDWFSEARSGSDLAGLRDRISMQDLFLPTGMGESHQTIILATAGSDMDLEGLRPPERWNRPSAA
jgi:SAM-dependent MidA family methyltransferase